ncbi:MAG: penicillin-binding transpeptidase domain-containing protein [Clostridia bacterium]|nr:penicillin-binding transpeptidase domain-containing protein [Clostridia bacterium]
MASNASPKIKQKLIWLFLVMCGIFMALVFRLFQVEILKGDEYSAKAARQQTRNSSLDAQRGRIFDRSGIVLAQSGTSYRVLVNPRMINPSERVRIASEVSDILGLDYDYVYTRVCRVEKQQIVLKRQVDSDTVDRITALQLGNGISFTTDLKRYYPMGQLAAQLVGFTGTDGEGQTGIEASYDEYLAGKNGRLVTPVDRSNNAIPYADEEYIAPVHGYDMNLTIDSVAQSYIEATLAEAYTLNRSVQVTAILMNPMTGEILGTASAPTYDLNNPPRSDVALLLEMSRNYSVSIKFEPGSAFKTFVLAAALDSGAISEHDTFTCQGTGPYGYETYGTKRVYCNGKHGTMTLQEAVAVDCDCAFMQMAHKMGVNTLYDYIYAFGFGQSTKSGIPGEDSGSVTHRKYIRDVELANLAIGKGITVTPMQMANAFSCVVNGGYLMQPYVVNNIVNASQSSEVIVQKEPTILNRVIKETTSAVVRKLLQGVTSTEKGNASNGQVLNYATGGKPGWAVRNDSEGLASDTLFVATYSGFIPVDRPELVCFLMIDKPAVPRSYAPTLAAPWVSKIFTSLARYYTIDPIQSESRTVPDVVGMTMLDAKQTLSSQAGLPCHVPDSEQDAIVTAQVPAANSVVPRQTRVILYDTMTGYNNEGVFVEMVEVPDFTNMARGYKYRRAEALDIASELGLTISFDPTHCTGYVTGQSIEPGTMVLPGTDIYLTFSGYYVAAKLPEPTPAPTPEPTPVPTPEPAVPEIPNEP